jgi:hypothetical protein
MSKKRDRLNSLAETHFISQNTVDSLLVKVIKPPKTLKLVSFQMSEEALGRVQDI